MHAINNTPTVPHDYYGLFGKLREANIPCARFHDTGGEFGGSRYIDIDNIFPNPDADENDPASYDFAFTDALLSELAKVGVKPFYRLGATIENNQRLRAYHIYPPKDFAKWARVCEMVVRHYNEGWADGYRFGIEYWEIWNEPDNEPEIADNPMWKGTKEQYFELYRTVYTHLKSCFPNLKIGGYASCGFYALSASDFSRTAHSSPRTDYFVEFFLDFLAYIKSNNVDLDFFSWHSYAGIGENVRYADYVRMKLDEFGYGGCEIIFNEWNPGIGLRGMQQDASNILAMMCAMQNSPTDMCMYYDGQMSSNYCGLFDPVKHTVFPAYYAFYIFGRLFELGIQAKCEVDCGGVYAIAAQNSRQRGIAIVNNSDAEVHVIVIADDIGDMNVYRLDDKHMFVKTEENAGDIILPPWGIIYAQT